MMAQNSVNFKHSLVLIFTLFVTSTVVLGSNPKARVTKKQLASLAATVLGGSDPHTRPENPAPTLVAFSKPAKPDKTPHTHPSVQAADCTASTCHSAPSAGLMRQRPATKNISSFSTSGTAGSFGTAGAKKPIMPDHTSAFSPHGVNELELN